MMRTLDGRSGAMRGVRSMTIALALAACGTSAAPGTAPTPSPQAAMSTTPLENTSWTLVDFGSTQARPIGPGAGGPTLRLDAAQKRASGNTGCNQYSGDYTLGGSTLRFGTLVSTRRACTDEALNRQEAAFLRVLGETAAYSISGDTLLLSGTTGSVAARLVATR